MKKREPKEEVCTTQTSDNTQSPPKEEKTPTEILPQEVVEENAPEKNDGALEKYMGNFVFQSVVKAVSEKIISAGRDEIVAVLNEIDQNESPTPLEKSIANALIMRLSYMDSVCSLEDEGADMGILEDEEFIEFARICDVNIPLKDIYKYYMHFKQNKVSTKPIGSAVGTVSSGRKNYYSPKDVDILSKEDFERDPQLLELVKKSMTKWK